jgi:hypothetical protein
VVCGVQRRAEAEDMEIWAAAWRKIVSATLGGENGPGPASLTPERSSNGSEETLGTPTTPASQYALFCCRSASVQHHGGALFGRCSKNMRSQSRAPPRRKYGCPTKTQSSTACESRCDEATGGLKKLSSEQCLCPIGSWQNRSPGAAAQRTAARILLRLPVRVHRRGASSCLIWHPCMQIHCDFFEDDHLHFFYPVSSYDPLPLTGRHVP